MYTILLTDGTNRHKIAHKAHILTFSLTGHQETTLELEGLTHWLLGVPHWRVKYSGVRQSKILIMAGLGRFRGERVLIQQLISN